MNDAIEEHIRFRNEEGQRLVEEFTLRIGNIQKAFDRVPEFETGRIASIKERIENNLEEGVAPASVIQSALLPNQLFQSIDAKLTARATDTFFEMNQACPPP